MKTESSSQPVPPKWAGSAKKIMAKKKIKQKDLVDVFNVGNDSTVGHYFKGRRQASIKQVSDLADYLGVSLDELMGRSVTGSGDPSFSGSADSELVGEPPGIAKLSDETRFIYQKAVEYQKYIDRKTAHEIVEFMEFKISKALKDGEINFHDKEEAIKFIKKIEDGKP